MLTDSFDFLRTAPLPGPPGSEMMQVALAKTLALKYNARLLIFDKLKMGLTGLASKATLSNASVPVDVNPLDGVWLGFYGFDKLERLSMPKIAKPGKFWR